MTSILDNIQQRRVNVLKSVFDDVDISGASFKLNPAMFKYIFVIPVWQIEMQFAKNYDLIPYLNVIDYLMNAFTPDYQILLRKLPYANDVPSEYFLNISAKESEFNCKNLLFDLKYEDYTGGIFVQFNTPVEWTYKKQFRFLTALMTILACQENVHSAHGKYLYVYRRHDEQSNEIIENWETLILTMPLHKMTSLLNLKSEKDYSTEELINKTYSNLKLLAAFTNKFNNPDIKNTESEIKQYKTHLYNLHFKKTKEPIKVDISPISELLCEDSYRPIQFKTLTRL